MSVRVEALPSSGFGVELGFGIQDLGFGKGWEPFQNTRDQRGSHGAGCAKDLAVTWSPPSPQAMGQRIHRNSHHINSKPALYQTKRNPTPL